MPPAATVSHATVEAGGLAFDCLVSGPREGTPVLLLHGFPQAPDCWRELMGELGAAGFRCLAPAQRGYSPGARPVEVSAYHPDRLVGDALAIAGAEFGGAPFHLVGHDLGGMVAWLLAARHGEALRTVSILSTPHPTAFLRSLTSSLQGLRSLYMPVFRMPALPERLFMAGSGAGLRAFLRAGGLDAEWAARYATALAQPGAMTAALNWYRAFPLRAEPLPPVRVPTLYVWGARDVALGRAAAEASAQYVSAPYTFHVAEGAGHWLPETRSQLLGELLPAHLARA
jgi:pimeloyl-ACP methyl ester carboxylesterase